MTKIIIFVCPGHKIVYIVLQAPKMWPLRNFPVALEGHDGIDQVIGKVSQEVSGADAFLALSLVKGDKFQFSHMFPQAFTNYMCLIHS